MARSGVDHGRACQLAGITRDELRQVIAGRRVERAAEQRVMGLLSTEVI